MGAVTGQSMKVSIWPRVLAAPQIFDFATEDLSFLRNAFDTDADLFGISMTFFSHDDRTLIATNRISAWTHGPRGRVGPCMPARRHAYTDVLLPLLGGTPEALLFAVRKALRAAPPAPTGREIELVATRETFLLTDRGFGMSKEPRLGQTHQSEAAERWQQLREAHDRMTPEAHEAACRGTETPHFGASVMTALVSPPSSNHERVAWIARIHDQMEKVLTHHGALETLRLDLHPRWRMPGLPEVA